MPERRSQDEGRWSRRDEAGRGLLTAKPGPQPGDRISPEPAVRLKEVAMEAKVGARIVVEGNKVGQGRREGEVVEVIATPEPVHYRVRWSDGHESIFFPSSDARVEATRRTSGAGRASRST